MGMHKKMVLVLALILALGAISMVADSGWAQVGNLQEAIQAAPQGTEPGQIDPTAPLGYLGIPGGPQINLILAFFWAVWVGWIFSTVGAFGGIMAGIGHITIYGLGNFAQDFRQTSPTINRAVTDSIRVSNQFMVGTSALIASINYYKLGRLVLPVAVALSIGSIAGSYIIPWLTAGRISFREYVGFFGIFVLFLGCYMLYETTPRGQASKKKAKQAAEAFESTMKRKRSGEKVDTSELGVKMTSFSAKRIAFTFYGVEFSFNPLYPILGGFVIAAIAAFLGVGGGFMLVPFLTSVTGLPMYLSAGTSALAVIIGMITSILSYLQQGVLVHWPLIGIQLVGIVVGSMVGPHTSQYIPDKWLKRFFIILAFYVGLNFMARGFLGQDLIGLIAGWFS
ncbi:MAG: sulfite exporter TauE/SafE family protein [Desulfovibrionales bacterium]|nr:MAG: sulfite exporter TauE/SafE family protein [Desulfovibrionales bacterium]